MWIGSISRLTVDNLGIFERDTSAAEGILAIKPAQRIDKIRTMAVPAILMYAMFFVVLTSAPQLANSVLEEKMSKISEVLLGSIRPFELMMGKLLGNAGITVVLAVLYMIFGYAIAAYYGYADMVSPGLVLAFGVFLLLAILVYGSLFMAVGAACNELKDAQSLLLPVMMFAMFPLFVWLGVRAESHESAGGGVDSGSDGFAVPDADASGPAAGTAVLARRVIDRADGADGSVLRVGGRQDLSDGALDARQEPHLPRAGAVGV